MTKPPVRLLRWRGGNISFIPALLSAKEAAALAAEDADEGRDIQKRETLPGRCALCTAADGSSVFSEGFRTSPIWYAEFWRMYAHDAS